MGFSINREMLGLIHGNELFNGFNQHKELLAQNLRGLFDSNIVNHNPVSNALNFHLDGITETLGLICNVCCLAPIAGAVTGAFASYTAFRRRPEGGFGNALAIEALAVGAGVWGVISGEPTLQQLAVLFLVGNILTTAAGLTVGGLLIRQALRDR